MAGKIIVSTLQSDTDNSISFVANTGATIFSANISHGIAGSFIANGSITGAKIALGSITGDDIATGQITGNLLTANCVSGNNIVSGVSLTSPSISGNTNFDSGTFFVDATNNKLGSGVTTGLVSTLTIYNGSGYGHFNYGNSDEDGPRPLLGAWNNVSGLAATFGWGIYDSNATGNLVVYRRSDSTTGIKALEIARGTGNFSFDSGYGSAAVAYGCRAWVNFQGTDTVAIRAGGNVSSVTDLGTGTYQVNYTTAMPDTNYAVTGTCERSGSDSDNALQAHRTRTTTSVVINTARSGTDLFDMLAPTVAIFR